jgi:hypothetical protein
MGERGGVRERGYRVDGEGRRVETINDAYFVSCSPALSFPLVGRRLSTPPAPSPPPTNPASTQ